MHILGIETSCDETAAAVVCDERTILSNVIATQIADHQPYGGIVPEIASRRHVENIATVINTAVSRAGLTLAQIDGIAVTQGPGLVGALLVGINTAKGLAYALQRPLVGLNHLEGHLLAPWIEHPPQFPNVTLVVSGGHTNLYRVDGPGSYRLLGRTRDDAAGEAFDKAAKLMGLGYPGGKVIDDLAAAGDPAAIAFPRPLSGRDTFDVSFSGLKTAMRNRLQAHPLRANDRQALCDLAASYSAAIVDVLSDRLLRAARRFNIATIAIGGGVACNRMLRTRLAAEAARAGLGFFRPSAELCTDNAAMIATAGYRHFAHPTPFPFHMNARSRWDL